MKKLTTAEAQELIEMLKQYIEGKRLNFPQAGKHLEFDVVGTGRSDVFTVNIYRQRINTNGCTYQGRVESDNTILMRLDVNPTAKHINPDGEVIMGTHLHIYTEEYEDKFAVPFNTDDKELIEICFTFFEKFSIIDMKDKILYQYSMDI